jgi:hypothetical protein
VEVIRQQNDLNSKPKLNTKIQKKEHKTQTAKRKTQALSGVIFAPIAAGFGMTSGSTSNVPFGSNDTSWQNDSASSSVYLCRPAKGSGR